MRVRATKETKRRREKIIKILNASATITVHICMITVAIMHKCTILHPLLWVFFWPKCVKGITFFILQYFTQANGVALTSLF